MLTLLAAALLAGCSGGSAQPPPAPTPDSATPGTTEITPLQPGDTRLLIARRNVIESITLSGQQFPLLELEGRVSIIEMALSTDGSRLAFVVELPAYLNEDGQLDFGADLYVSDADGSNARLLLAHENTGDYFEAPAWLNETTLLVGSRGYSVDSGSFSRIHTVDVDTAAHQAVLHNAAMGALSPDRQLIAYTAIDPQTRVQRLVIEHLTAEDEPRVLVDEYAGLALFSAVAFSPDGSRLAFAAVDLIESVPPPMPPAPSGTSFQLSAASVPALHPFAQDVWLVDPNDGTGLHRIADIAENMPAVSWSGDGGYLYVFGPGFLWRLDPVTGAAEQLRQTGERGSVIWLEGE